jgi:hypothetical protein
VADNNTKTYVLVGHDNNNAFGGLVSAFARRANLKGDVVLLQADAYPNTSYPTIEEAVKAIEPPARIVVAAHGSPDSSFEWASGQRVGYDALFKALPREGVELVTVAGCHGSSAEQAAANLPAGTVLQSLVSEAVPGWSGALTRFADEVVSQRGPLTTLSFLLKGLDNTDPRDSVDSAINDREDAKANKRQTFDYKKDDVLPYSFSIGGNPPAHVDLDQEVSNLRGRTQAGPAAKANYEAAVAVVFSHIDGKSSDTFNAYDIDEVQRQVRDTAQHILEGKPIGIDEKRIAYAIAIANLHTSGEMGSMVNEQSESQHLNPDTKPRIHARWDGKGDPIVAQIQAVFEASGFATDNGGPRDGAVSGQMNTKTSELIGLIQRMTKHPKDAPLSTMLEAIRKDEGLLKSFAGMQGEDGTRRLDIQLSTPRTTERDTPSR